MVRQLSPLIKAALPSLVALALVWGLLNWWTLGFQAFTSYSHVRESAAPLPQSPPRLTLIDQVGKPLQLDELQGKYYLMTFGFLDCTGTCPVSMAAFNEINGHLQSLGIDDLVLLTITLDPARDRQQHLHYVWQSFDSPAGWILARPQVQDIPAYWAKLRRMGMWVDQDKLGTPIHDDRSFLINRAGMIVQSFAGVPPIEALLESIQRDQG